MTARRIIRLLEEKPALTARQVAQRKYRASVKGKAAAARALAVQRAKPDFIAKTYTRVKRWRHAHAVHVRVYNRVVRARRRAEGLGAAA
jgi:hypothetical protein